MFNVRKLRRWLVLGLNFPVRLDVFESQLYWVSEERGMLSTMDKFGRGVNRTLQTGLVRPHAIKMFHPNKHDIASTDSDAAIAAIAAAAAAADDDMMMFYFSI